MGTCPSKPGDALAPKANAGPKLNAGPKPNAGPKLNAGPKPNNIQLTEEQKLEKEINDLDNKIRGLESSQDYQFSAELRFTTVPELKRKKKKLEDNLEKLKNPKVISESPEPSAPTLPNAPAPSEEPTQAGGKRRRRTMKRKSRRRQPKRKH